MRRAANIDRNHAELVNAFRGLGCSVISLAAVGKGCPDLLVGVECGPRRLNLLVEVKAFRDGTVKGELGPEQAAWHREWRGQVAVVRSLEDAGRLVRAAREEAEMLREVKEMASVDPA